MKGLVILVSLGFLAVSVAVPDRLGGHHNHPPHAHPPPQNGYKLPHPPPLPPTYVPPTKTPPSPPPPPTYRPYTTAPPTTYRPYTTAPPTTYRPYTTAPPTTYRPYTTAPPTTYRPYTTAPPTTYRPYTTAPPSSPPLSTYLPPTTAKPPPYTYGPPVTTTEKPKYWFEWEVNDHYSGNEYNMQEHRDGEKTEGFYNVLLPDTRVQRVTYTVDGDSGFVAEVTYEGEAKEPTHGQTYLLPTPPTSPPSIYDAPHYSR
ncbi:early nodulin-75-like [Penaeus chinensis]|uniref:early nodulin-75-like n=1 Tax=Penaeus chinensis TaxID=139456 RepID=UPI001FB827B2|nr:early nodulin-75-like [Penaeus chinensis]